MTDLELQDEEREVLLSIYDGDECFKQTSSNVFQYKVETEFCFFLVVAQNKHF